MLEEKPHRKYCSSTDPEVQLEAITRASRILERDEEVSLYKQWQCGDKEAGDTIILSQIRYVLKEAYKIKRRNPHFKLVELVNEGICGAALALQKFDLRGFRFSTYAHWWIKDSLYSYEAENAGSTKIGSTQNEIRILNCIGKISAAFRGEYLRDPTLAELANIMDVSEKDILSYWEKRRPAVSFETPIHSNKHSNGDEGLRLEEVIAAPDNSSGAIVEEKDTSETINRLVAEFRARLSGRDLIIFDERLWVTDDNTRAMTLKELGNEFKLSRERARQVEKDLVIRFRKFFMSHGYFKDMPKEASDKRSIRKLGAKKRKGQGNDHSII